MFNLGEISMKKSLIALAALAAVTAASAQSTVTISGGIGLALGKTVIGEDSSGLQIARQTGNIAFKGTEDLGGGLKAGFEVQTAIGAVASTNTEFDNDAKAKKRTILGDRALNMNLSGDFGTLVLGRGNTAIRSLWGAIGDVSNLPVTTGVSDGAFGANDAAARVIYGDTFTNYVGYNSPSVGGFSVSLAVAPTQSAAGSTAISNNGTSSVYKDTVSYSLRYTNGPVDAAVNITNVAQDNGAKITTALASYDFGVAKVGVTTQSVNLNAEDAINPGSANYVTVMVPVGPGNLSFGFGKRGASESAVGDDVKQTFIGYKYMFSKRTSISGVYNKLDRVGTAADTKETQLIVAHTF